MLSINEGVPTISLGHRCNWSEHWNLCRMLQTCKRSLGRLSVYSAGSTVHTGTFQALCNQLVLLSQLETLDVRIKCGHLGDTAMDHLGSVIPRLTQLKRLSVEVPMNSITIVESCFRASLCTKIWSRLQRFMSHVVNAPVVKDLRMNLSGNWIRGVACG